MQGSVTQVPRWSVFAQTWPFNGVNKRFVRERDWGPCLTLREARSLVRQSTKVSDLSWYLPGSGTRERARQMCGSVIETLRNFKKLAIA